ncbi:hypothetical protein [Acinetobacter lanii]|uniref:Uncharacterized protein n=1 Tax=Acinetobacter lanii TaxID=2715163 RepID=A0A6G8S464_9GAMM|nr:hypothetical protein [Acinetobacter lanii]QIO08942.1 hypothetical protein G8D99_07900 [Acinetobacter lanii]
MVQLKFRRKYMQGLHLYIKPTTSFEAFVEVVGEIIGYPIINYETDRYDEYPGYEIDYDETLITILGVPPDLENLREMFPEEFGFGEKAETYQVYIRFKTLPLQINDILNIDYISDKDFGENLIQQLINKGFEISDTYPPCYLSDEDE